MHVLEGELPTVLGANELGLGSGGGTALALHLEAGEGLSNPFNHVAIPCVNPGRRQQQQ